MIQPDLFQLLINPNCRKFVNVCFHECSRVSDDILKMLPFYFYCGGTEVNDINMSCCVMRDNGICTRLSLMDCNIDDDGAKLLAEGLKSCILLKC